MIIIGAGMAGLIAAHHFRRFDPVVKEVQPTLPKNHAAVLRFRSPAIGHLTGIPFRKVRMCKAIWDKGKMHKDLTLRIENQYSQKVTGKILGRSIANIEDEDRWIAPDDFVDQMACGIGRDRIWLGNGLSGQPINCDDTIISTIPLPSLAKHLGIDPTSIGSFECRPVWVIRGSIDTFCDVYQTVYNPSPCGHWYRASITGSTAIIECTQDDIMSTDHSEACDVCADVVNRIFGIESPVSDVEVVCQKLGKITPVDDRKRKAFIVQASADHNIYSLGRFACWRPTLLDDLINDLEVIDNLITNGSNYGALIKRNKE
jgi:hypothetical protein